MRISESLTTTESSPGGASGSANDLRLFRLSTLRERENRFLPPAERGKSVSATSSLCKGCICAGHQSVAEIYSLPATYHLFILLDGRQVREQASGANLCIRYMRPGRAWVFARVVHGFPMR